MDFKFHLPFGPVDQSWIDISIRDGYTLLNIDICSSLISPMTLDDPSPTDTLDKYCSEGEIFTVREVLHGRYTDAMAARAFFFLCWPDEKSSFAPKTEYITRLMDNFLTAHMNYDYTKSPHCLLLSAHTHFQASSQKENQITISLFSELPAWYG